MAAREKLNLAFATGALITATVIGSAIGSWTAFVVALVLSLAAGLYGGGIRAPRR